MDFCLPLNYHFISVRKKNQVSRYGWKLKIYKEAVADGAQWVVTEIRGWEGIKNFSPQKNPASYVILHRASTSLLL
jgi:hypothetical protein